MPLCHNLHNFKNIITDTLLLYVTIICLTRARKKKLLPSGNWTEYWFTQDSVEYKQYANIILKDGKLNNTNPSLGTTAIALARSISDQKRTFLYFWSMPITSILLVSPSVQYIFSVYQSIAIPDGVIKPVETILTYKYSFF